MTNYLVNFSFIARTIYRHRANMFPPLPNDQTFEISKQFSQTKRSESIIIYDGYKKKYDGRLLLFSTDELLQQLCETEFSLVDGTFASSPTGFEQLVIIMGSINDEEQLIEQHVQQLVVGKIQTNGSARAPENNTISQSISNLNKKYINGNLYIEKYLKECTFLIGNVDVGSANANKMVSSTAATVCPTKPPPKKKLATKT
ncbi:unnamed protein product [Rotaria magnacalcarata]